MDLAKNVLAEHGVDETGKPALMRPELPRAKPIERMAHLPPCPIGMEACSGAHHWAREFAKLGHTVRLMASKFAAYRRAIQPRWISVGAKVGKPLQPESSRSALARCRAWMAG